VSVGSPRKVRYAVASTNFFSRLVTGFWAAHSGFWLGLLTHEQLDAATIEFYSADRQFLDPDHNVRGLAPWEAHAIDAYTEPGSRVLVPAAGGGREILALADMGYDATGYDPTPELVDLGNRLITKTGAKATLLLSHGNNLPERLDPPYDWALFGWGSISHVQGSGNRVAVLRSVHDVLVQGGVFMVSFLPREPNSLRYNLVYRVARTVRDLRRSHDALELGDTIDGSFDHRFTFDEIGKELGAAGFEELERITEGYPVVVCRRQ
jgi:SAM-dependent methyltransferase